MNRHSTTKDLAEHLARTAESYERDQARWNKAHGIREGMCRKCGVRKGHYAISTAHHRVDTLLYCKPCWREFARRMKREGVADLPVNPHLPRGTNTIDLTGRALDRPIVKALEEK